METVYTGVVFSYCGYIMNMNKVPFVMFEIKYLFFYNISFETKYKLIQFFYFLHRNGPGNAFVLLQDHKMYVMW